MARPIRQRQPHPRRDPRTRFWCHPQAIQTGQEGQFVFVVGTDMKVTPHPVVAGPAIGPRHRDRARHCRRRDRRDRRPTAPDARRHRAHQGFAVRAELHHESRRNLHPPSRDDDADLDGDRHLRPLCLSLAAGQRSPQRRFSDDRGSVPASPAPVPKRWRRPSRRRSKSSSRRSPDWSR